MKYSHMTEFFNLVEKKKKKWLSEKGEVRVLKAQG